MTDLERFAAALLTQWRADGGADGGPITVAALLDRVLPYRVARRILGIDISEDYEAMVLRLVAEDEDLARVEPVDAADMAKATINSRLPDLDALQLLRSATVTITDRAIARLADVLPMPSPKDESKWATAPAVTNEPSLARAAETPPPEVVAKPAPSRKKGAQRTTEGDAPQSPRDNDVIPLHPVAPATTASALAGPPPDFLTSVTFTPPAPVHCWSCAETMPADRAVKFCPFCGADQRQPTCSACGAPAERGWKHCPDCGTKL